LPSIDILRLYHTLGGTILTVGSDSHQSETVGSNQKRAIEMAKEAGFEGIYVFEKRKPKKINF